MNERDYRNIMLEGGEGYNPIAIDRQEKEDAQNRMWVAEQKAKEHALVVAEMKKLGITIN